MTGHSHYGCNRRRSSGPVACQGPYIRIDTIQNRVVNAIRRGLISQEVVDAFVLQARESFTAHHERTSSHLESLKVQLVRVETKIRNLLDQAESGLGRGASALGERIQEREQDRLTLLRQIEDLSVEAPLVPDIPDFEAAYQRVINDLRSTLSSAGYVQPGLRTHMTDDRGGFL